MFRWSTDEKRTIKGKLGRYHIIIMDKHTHDNFMIGFKIERQ